LDKERTWNETAAIMGAGPTVYWYMRKNRPRVCVVAAERIEQWAESEMPNVAAPLEPRR